MKKAISILVFTVIVNQIKAQTYRKLFDQLDATFVTQDYSFYTQFEGGRVEVNSGIMDAYLNMFEATKDIKYLNEFLICSKRAMDRRDDFITVNTYVEGFPILFEKCESRIIPQAAGGYPYQAWSRLECLNDIVQYYPNFKESGSITFPMARFVLLILENPQLSNIILPNEVNSHFNNLNYGNNTITNMGEYAHWMKSRVYETLNFHYSHDWDNSEGRFLDENYCNGKGYNMQCSIGKTLILMNYIAYLENDNATVAVYRNVIEKIATKLYDNVLANTPTNPATVGNSLPWYTWLHYDGNNDLIEDISHAMLDVEFAELYLDYFYPITGYYRFNYSHMQKFANGFSYRVVANPHELKMNTYGTNCNCNQMCCDCDQGPGPAIEGCLEVNQNPLASYYYYQSEAYTFLTKFNNDIYQQVVDFFMPGNPYQTYANVATLHAYSLLAKYQNIFNPLLSVVSELRSLYLKC